MTKFARFLKDESGATAIEYGLIVALIAVVIIAAVTAIGTSISRSSRRWAVTTTSSTSETRTWVDWATAWPPNVEANAITLTPQTNWARISSPFL